jgi:hypothetical protein
VPTPTPDVIEQTTKRYREAYRRLTREEFQIYLAKVYITMKSVVNDLQGLTIRGGFIRWALKMCRALRVGNYMYIKK